MLAVISDLHFEEERSDHILGSGKNPPIQYSRNLPGKAFRRFIAHLAGEAVRNKAEKLDLVLAGDIFDIHRSSLWFTPESKGIRPYVDLQEVDGRLEKQVLFILNSIKNESPVADALTAFDLLSKGRYADGGTQRFPVPASIHLLPGNHDRLLNATPDIRKFVRTQLGIDGGSKPFPHIYVSSEEGVVVRHGHEYDRYNFSRDVSRDQTIPLNLPDSAYNAAAFGDFATVDLASRIPSLFRQHHGDETILADPLLRRVYWRLLDFDDLRPQRAILNFLLNMPGNQIDQAAVWQAIEPILLQLLEDIQDDPFMEYWLNKMDKRWRIDAIDVVQTSLALKSWRLTGLPLGLAQFTSNAILSSDQLFNDVPKLAANEEVIQQGEYRFLIAGHTHFPTTELLANDNKGERYYIDTGTWRNRIAATRDYTAFARLKAMTYVVVYGPKEDPGDGAMGKKFASFDFWSGATQRWYT